MVLEQSTKVKINFELMKLFLVSFVILSGGIVFAVFVPLRDFLLWRDFFFYVSIGILIITYFSFSYTFQRKRLNSINYENDKLDHVPSTSSVSKTSKITSLKYTIQTPKAAKRAVKIDEHAITYCPRCGRSFIKNHKFCPNCGFCGIQKVP